MKRILPAKKIQIVTFTGLIFFMICSQSMASGLFGPLQTVSREQGGLNTAIGYLYHEDTYKDGKSYKIEQNEIYTQAGYGANNIWEVFARIGLSDMTMPGLFASSDHFVETSKDDFEENWKFFGSLGAKAFYPINAQYGIGAFLQGTYYASNFSDTGSITSGGTPVRTEIKVKRLWDADLGIGFQDKLRCGTKLYAGPYLYYSDAKISQASDLYGNEFGSKEYSVSNRSLVGAFAGADIPLRKGFRLNLEGQYADKFSFGAAVSYTY